MGFGRLGRTWYVEDRGVQLNEKWRVLAENHYDRSGGRRWIWPGAHTRVENTSNQEPSRSSMKS